MGSQTYNPVVDGGTTVASGPDSRNGSASRFPSVPSYGSLASASNPSSMPSSMPTSPMRRHWTYEPDGLIACGICMQQFAPKDVVQELRCGHYYHEECLANVGPLYCPECSRAALRGQ